ncbi:hypothetical protein D623_10014178 [Myotis brandtii]|uniref:Uncharacterized protein n=1 Tax=Myotis brandtii TaxID=109478 RepID=S7NN32_MYOBR|nr:hypothetical protein D623_10014178 [Myotis brandtii]
MAQDHLQSPHRAARPHRPLHPARYRGPEPKDGRQRNRDTGPLPSKPKHRPLPTARGTATPFLLKVPPTTAVANQKASLPEGPPLP